MCDRCTGRTTSVHARPEVVARASIWIQSIYRDGTNLRRVSVVEPPRDGHVDKVRVSALHSSPIMDASCDFLSGAVPTNETW